MEGTKEKGIDDYTGTYTADYENFSDIEYLFGGTSIKREAGKELSIDCTLGVMEGTAKAFWISGSDEAVTLIETTGTYSDTMTLPDGRNYIGIECGNQAGTSRNPLVPAAIMTFVSTHLEGRKVRCYRGFLAWFERRKYRSILIPANAV